MITALIPPICLMALILVKLRFKDQHTAFLILTALGAGAALGTLSRLGIPDYGDGWEAAPRIVLNIIMIASAVAIGSCWRAVNPIAGPTTGTGATGRAYRYTADDHQALRLAGLLLKEQNLLVQAIGFTAIAMCTLAVALGLLAGDDGTVFALSLPWGSPPISVTLSLEDPNSFIYLPVLVLGATHLSALIATLISQFRTSRG
ncbi:hypothetical protein [Nesterenkonia rhizosphaerae]|uniref:Uncharacterized protein n=1 Tax=Nesterenkonia rhizosphaerae TaxID=1348272 RepID=A0ABP9G1F2_9MICC